MVAAEREVGEVVAPKPRLRGAAHFYAFFVSLAVGPVLVISAPDARATGCAAVYAVSVCGMLGASALLHRGTWSAAHARRLTNLDHAMIYLLIAGTYTPISLIVLTGWVRATVFLLVWLGAVVGTGLELSWRRPPRGWVTCVYITLGWVGVISVPQLWTRLGVGSLLIVGGGLAYTVGALVHAARWPDPRPAVFGYHEVFHVFVLAAVAMHYGVIAALVLPKG